MGSVSNQRFAGGGAKALEEALEDAARAAEEPQLLQVAGICKWFNVSMGFGFLSATACVQVALVPPVYDFVHWSKLHMEDFRSLKEGEAVEFTFNPTELPALVGCSVLGVRRPKEENKQKRRSKEDRCYNRGGLDHHTKECQLPPHPKKCHISQSISHMVASCSLKAQQAPSSQGKPTFRMKKKRFIVLPCSQMPRIEPQWRGVALLL